MDNNLVKKIEGLENSIKQFSATSTFDFSKPNKNGTTYDPEAFKKAIEKAVTGVAEDVVLEDENGNTRETTLYPRVVFNENQDDMKIISMDVIWEEGKNIDVQRSSPDGGVEP